MIEIRATNHVTARIAAMDRAGNRPVFICAVYRCEGDDYSRYVFRTTSIGGCA
jgi:hypothetical protein